MRSTVTRSTSTSNSTVADDFSTRPSSTTQTSPRSLPQNLTTRANLSTESTSAPTTDPTATLPISSSSTGLTTERINDISTATTSRATQTPRPLETESTPSPIAHFPDFSEEIKNTVRDEIERVVSKVIEEEVEREIEEKIGSKKISSSRRSRVHRKVMTDVKKRALEIIEKKIEDQLGAKPNLFFDDKRRVSSDIETEIIEEIQTVVRRSMEKAIADEILEQVKIEKLTRTPTIEPELAGPGLFGVRHAQTFMVLLFLTISYMQRVDLYVAEVAMTQADKANPNFIEFGWSETVLSLLLSSFNWGYFWLQLPGGILAEKYGPKMVMTVSMLACSLLGILTPVAALLGDWIGVYLMKLLQGFFQGTFIPAVYVFTSRWIPPKEKSRLFTPAFGGIIFWYCDSFIKNAPNYFYIPKHYLLGMQLGTVIGMPITGILCASFLGWPTAFFFSGCVGFFWVVVWIFMAANSPSVHRSISREEKLYIEGSFGFGEITVKGAEKIIPWRSILSSVPFWALIVSHFGQSWAFTTLITEMPLYINFVLGLNITDNAFYSAMTYFVGWVLIVIFGFIANYFDFMSLTVQRKAWNSVAAFGGSISFLILGLMPTRNQALAITLLTVIVATNSATYNGLFSNHADLSPNYIGVLMGLSNTISNLASIFAPMFVGFIVKDESDPHQWSIVFLTSAAILFISNLVFVLFGTAEIQPWNTPSDLHLHLEKVDAAAAAAHAQRFGRRHAYMVTNTEDEQLSKSPKHRNSI